MIDFGGKLKKLRTSRGISQSQLAERIRVTKSMISAYENSVRLPSYDVLIRICLFFKVSADYFFGFDKHKYLDVTGLPDEQVALLSMLIDEFKGNNSK
jgi:transcriptional regulator with XRE-family HTH domain